MQRYSKRQDLNPFLLTQKPKISLSAKGDFSPPTASYHLRATLNSREVFLLLPPPRPEEEPAPRPTLL